jgi:hypothetical protein
VVRTRLPTARKAMSTEVVQEAREKDKQERLKRKEVRDKRKTAQEKMVKPGDKVLVAQRKTTTKPPFDPNPYTITEVKGTQVTVEREGKRPRKRNLAKIKILKERPERLRAKRRESAEGEEEESIEWWELPNTKAVPLDDQAVQAGPVEGVGGGLQQQAGEHQPPPEAEVQQQEREQRQAPKERWEVAQGPWRPKNNSLSPRDRKKKQQAARRRDKERSQHPYQLRSRPNKGEGEQQEEEQQEEELSD